MKSLLVAAAVLVGAAVAAPAPSQAENFSVRIGNGHHHHHHWDRGWHRGWRAHARDCRVVVIHKWHHGHRVTVRRKTCY
jgi:Spy/CpxP family protein refolding chaperone